MKNIILILFIFYTLNGCKKENGTIENMYVAEVVGYDFNCSTCLLYFPKDTNRIKEILGYSPSIVYQTVNLNQTDFDIGQLIKVKVRLAAENEVSPCKSLYPTFNYTNIYVTEFSDYQNSNFLDTCELSVGECHVIFGKAILCFDSVLNDSRCPNGARCVWAGNAKVKFGLTMAGQERQYFELNTNRGFQTDTLIDHLKISLLGLTPYPNINSEIRLSDYKVELSIVDNRSVKSNAQILNFNPDKEMCSWGWTIKMGNDTIKSDNDLIGKAVGYEFSEPLDVYIQIGEKEHYCSDFGGFDYYHVERIIRTE